MKTLFQIVFSLRLYPNKAVCYEQGGVDETPFFIVWMGHKMLFAIGVGLHYAWARLSLKGAGCSGLR